MEPAWNFMPPYFSPFYKMELYHIPGNVPRTEASIN